MGLFKILIYSAFSLCERYIVMFNMSSNGTGPTALEDSVQTYSSRLANAMSYMDGEDKIVTKTRMGFIADMKDSTAVKMNNCPDIAVVEKDGPVHIAFNKGTDVKTPPNYTDGIKEVNIPFSSLYGDKYKKIQKHDSAYFRKGSGKMKTRKIISHESEDYDNSESTTSSDISNSSTDSGSYYKHDFEGQNNKYSIPFCDEEVYLKNKNSKPIKKEFPQGDEKEFPQGDEKEFPQGDEKEFLRGGEKEFLEGDKKDLPKVKPVVNNIKNKTEDNFKIKYKVRKIFRKLKSGGLEKNKSPKNPKSPKKRKMSPWGLKRISQIENWNNQSFVFPIRAGRNVEVFVIDTGIDAEHPEFGGRARLGANFIENSPNTDENGHGTHVAGIIGSECCGVAKEAKIVGVKVLDQHGAGKISKVIQGIDYVIGEHSKKFEEDAYDALFNKMNAVDKPLVIKGTKIFIRNKKSMSLIEDESSFLHDVSQLRDHEPQTIINMSVGGFKNKALDFAVEFASNIGIHFAVAAGNDHNDACNYSPSSSRRTMTVGASTIDDRSAFFSNYGSCVDIYAPGVDIISLWKNGGYRLASGTSMASPHVAGVMALYLEMHNYTQQELYARIVKDSITVVDNEAGKSRWPWSLFKKRGYPLVNINKLIDEIESHQKEEKNKDGKKKETGSIMK